MGGAGWVGWLCAGRSSARVGGAVRRGRSRGGGAARCVALPVSGAVLHIPGDGRVGPGLV
eukprot:637896-Heterocapsa_arctica.AAC.1